MKMVIAVAALLLAGNVAFAQGGNDNSISEFHQHAMGGQLEITPHLDYDTITIDPGSQKTNGFRIGSEVEYGVAERLSVGADLTFKSWTTDTSPETKTSGLEDIILFTRGSAAMGTGRLAYGANLGYSLGDQETSGNDVDAQTGGMSLNPYVGYEMMAGPGLWGARVNYNWLGERTATNGGAETKTEGGSALGLATFYEYAMSETMDLGAALSYTMTAETEVAGAGRSDDSNTIGLRVYAPIEAGTNMTVVPRLNWATVDGNGTAEASLLGLGADLRMLF